MLDNSLMHVLNPIDLFFFLKFHHDTFCLVCQPPSSHWDKKSVLKTVFTNYCYRGSSCIWYVSTFLHMFILAISINKQRKGREIFLGSKRNDKSSQNCIRISTFFISVQVSDPLHFSLLSFLRSIPLHTCLSGMLCMSLHLFVYQHAYLSASFSSIESSHTDNKSLDEQKLEQINPGNQNLAIKSISHLKRN